MNQSPAFFNRGRVVLWGLTALLMLALPLIFRQGFAITLLSQMGTMIIFALSYNMLLGQSGMLSFGHAVYSGLGAFFAIHALNMMSKGSLPVAVTWLPLVGGIAGALFGVIFGYVSTKRSGTTFAMISMGLGELVFACSLMFPGFFGGEGGINGNRAIGTPFLGLDYKSPIQVYYLIAAWCFVCMIAMYAFTQTPLGRMANAVRDNPERVEFIGYDTQKVRWLVLIVASFFAGISGGLSAIMFEIVTAENVSAIRSGGVLLATFIGGVTFFFGPILGACLFIFFVVALSEFTKAWLLYLGIFFVLMVMYAPGGLASLILMQFPLLKAKRFKEMLPLYARAGVAGLVMAAGLIALIEMAYHYSLESASGTTTSVFGIKADVANAMPWMVAVALFVAGLAAFVRFGPKVKSRYGEIQAELLAKTVGAA
jgi:branched-chain amino acid transport system permease protein